MGDSLTLIDEFFSKMLKVKSLGEMSKIRSFKNVAENLPPAPVCEVLDSLVCVGTYVRMYVRMYVCMHVCMHVCMYAFIHSFIHVEHLYSASSRELY